MAENWDTEDRNVPEIYQRLSKFLQDVSKMTDKGFVGTSRFYPNCNDVFTPLPMVSKRAIKQHTIKEICQRRYTSEAAYSCVVIPDSLRGVIPFENIDAFEYEWAMVEINLGS